MNDSSAMPVTSTNPPARNVDRASASPLGWLRGEIDRLFDDFSIDQPPRSIFNFGGLEALRPAADLVDEGSSYRLSVELPGLKQDDIDIEYRDGELTIAGEKKGESESKKDGCIISERRYGSFRRRLSLPGDVAADGISAEFKDGVLTLQLKKDENAVAKPRKIQIS